MTKKGSRAGLYARARRQASALLGRPPRDGIPKHLADSDFHDSEVLIYKLIAERELRAGWGKSVAGKRSLLLSQAVLERFVSSCDSRRKRFDKELVLLDGAPLAKLAREFGNMEPTVRRWCRWNPHPGLGRKFTG